jgi:hypothetical protein
MLRNPAKAGLAFDTLSTVYQDKKAIPIVIELARVINQYALAKKEFQLNRQSELEETITISMPASYKTKLRVIANETQDANGRRLGVQKFIRILLIDLVDKKFGGCQNDNKSRTEYGKVSVQPTKPTKRIR